MNYLKIGQMMKKLRLEQKKTQAVVSEAAGINEKYLSRIENGRENISLEVFVGIANALGADANLLLGNDLKVLGSGEGCGTEARERLHLQVDSLSESEVRFFSECIRLKRELGA